MISASLSLSLPRFGWKSTSTPRSLKICTAAGDSASEMRTFGFDMDLSPEQFGKEAAVCGDDGDSGTKRVRQRAVAERYGVEHAAGQYATGNRPADGCANLVPVAGVIDA